LRELRSALQREIIAQETGEEAVAA
jgi:hypothetical protein